MPQRRNRAGARAITAVSTSTTSGLKARRSTATKSSSASWITAPRLVAASLEAMVGATTRRAPSTMETALPASIARPPPAATTTSASPIASASAWMVWRVTKPEKACIGADAPRAAAKRGSSRSRTSASATTAGLVPSLAAASPSWSRTPGPWM